ncbi:methyltransferase domain-containing protein [Sphingobacterium deserti]|uniref:Trans-aconitate 2-methyltransferase n=1 Tax=Sphingobacterium deserti TaxID=1229276 RepID=A0A0B8SYX3_9SPHI|nr:methyltransferase domain-containing protein [Sphingobacterium deserti]KGE12446.1 trans-aconitate 2-methyltransferase [Sphingobacterium deserti]
MPWNPNIYNDFKDIRYKPFYDLLSFIDQSQSPANGVDLGCGTGEQTAILAEHFPDTTWLGVDSSPDMLADAPQSNASNLSFRHQTIEHVISTGGRWDVIFSNAALQWTDDHKLLFPKLLELLNPGGQFAVQMPVQTENKLNKILFSLANEEPFKSYLNGWNRPSSVLNSDEYAEIMFEAGLVNIRIEQRIYPIIAEQHNTLFNFISGSALIPYMERLEGVQQEAFVDNFKKRIAEAFSKLPAMYAFKRLFLFGTK